MYLLPHPEAKLLFNDSKNYNMTNSCFYCGTFNGKTKEEVGVYARMVEVIRVHSKDKKKKIARCSFYISFCRSPKTNT